MAESGRSKAIQARTAHIMRLVDGHAEATRKAAQLREQADAMAEAGDTREAAALLREADVSSGQAARMHQMIRNNVIHALTYAAEKL